MWIPKEKKNPVIHLHPTRKSVGYFGAVRLRDGKFVSDKPDGRFDRISFLHFLKKFRMTTARCNKTIVLLMDNAKYHHAKEITEWIRTLDGKIIILFLPPYSPELNLIERVWKLVRRTTTHNDTLYPSMSLLDR
jgi:transposase